MTQPPLFPIEVVDPAEVEPEDHRIARMNAADVYNQRILSALYARKVPEIIASRDVIRIRLYRAWAEKRMGREAHGRDSGVTILLISGSREATPAMLDYARRCVDRAFDLGYEIHVGDAEGVDECVMNHAHKLGAMCVVYGANGRLRRRTNSCSPEIVTGNYLARDKVMAAAAEIVVGIWNGRSKGTMHTVRYAREMGKVVHVMDFSKVKS